MLDKKLIFQLNKKGHSQAQIARIMGVSRQRIGQVLTNYFNIRNITKYKVKNKRQKKSLANYIDKLRNNNCRICYEKAGAIHHIDRNSRNNTKSNLLEVCIKCHKELHLRELTKRLIKYTPTSNFWNKNHSECIICRNTKDKYYAKGLCKRCYQIYRYHIRKKLQEELV